ncbi:TatD family hydrolase [Sphingobacterium endophyticum]|uniref:TatD family hydrolase n=1 Tax=Sphingobacterium endophyticum TaxID=2546448 RepID=UPI0012E194D8|nr:TatD family hydrolase [Sphingobacterium endophyticum]
MVEQFDLNNQSLTDTHTHIYYQAGSEKLKEQMDRCFKNGITRLFLPNVDVSSIEKVFETVAAYPDHCFPMLGLHPCDVKEDYEVQLEQIYAKIQTSKIYAIGEIGIDLYWDKSTLEIQKDAFRKQIEWSKELGLPISIHCREAFNEVFEVLEEMADDRLFGIFHCFTGTLEQAHRAIKLGFKLGIGGVVTFKKAGLDAVVKEISLEHIVLETDAPYLAPVPFRGKENESSYLVYVAQKVADLHEIGIDKVAEITTNNSKQIFKI